MSFAQPFVVWIVSTIVLALIASIIAMVMTYRHGSVRSVIWEVSVWAFLCTFMGYGMVSFFVITHHLTTRINDQSLIVNNAGLIMETIPDETTLWRWDQRLKGNRVISYQRHIMLVNVDGKELTYNEEKRVYRFTFEIAVLGSPEAYSKMLALTQGKDLQEWFDDIGRAFADQQYHAYWQFTNNEDPCQREEFRSLARNYVEQLLSDSGAEFCNAYFSVQRLPSVQQVPRYPSNDAVVRAV